MTSTEGKTSIIKLNKLHYQQSNIKTHTTPDNNLEHGMISNIEINISFEPKGFVMNEYMMLIYKELDAFIDLGRKEKLIEDRKYDDGLDEWLKEESQ